MKWILALIVLSLLGAVAWFFLFRGGKDSQATGTLPASVLTGTAASVPPPPPPPPELTMATFRLTPLPLSLPAKLQAQANSGCTSAILIDWTTKELLWAKNPDTAVPIASMTKMMTTQLLMEAIHKEKRVDMQTRVQVTRACSKIGGSQVWLDPRESFTVEELTKCVMVKSANDAAYLLGEFLANGDYAAFVARMNQRAAELGCTGMKFYNSHGLPPDPKSPENQATPRELAMLAARLVEYPDLMQICGIKLDALQRPATNPGKPTEIFNHNTLISKRPCAGVDGMKTGLTNKSGHCITATCLRNGRRLIAVVCGGHTAIDRDRLTAALLDWGYAQQAARQTAAAAAPARIPVAATPAKVPAAVPASPPIRSR